MNIKQFADGSLGLQSPTEGVSLFRVGGPKAATATVPNFRGTQWLKLTANGGVNTGGGLTSWQNTLGYDIIVTGFILDVTTVASAACTASFGVTAVSGTTLDTTFTNSTDVHSAVITISAASGTVPASKVAVNTFITGSVGTGASAGLVANVYVQYIVA